MKKNKIGILLLSLLVIIIVYLFVTGIERVPGGSVNVVMEIGTDGTQVMMKPRALVNTGTRSRVFFKQPKIPFTGIGYLKESFNLDEDMDFSTAFAYYTLDELTGRPEDGERVNACVIEGTVGEVTDWEIFIPILDPDKINTDDNPYALKFRNRSEIIAEQLKYLSRSGTPESLYPGAGEAREQVMTPGQKIEFWYQELISRRNFIVSLRDRMGFTEEGEFVTYLSEQKCWYWGLGVREYEGLLNQAKELNEYLQTPFSENLTARGYSSRYMNDEDSLLLLNMIRRTDGLERSLLTAEDNISALRSRQDELYRTGEGELAMMLYEEYAADLSSRGRVLPDMEISELNNDFITYVETEISDRLLTALRKKKLELAMENFAAYKADTVGTIVLNAEQERDVERATDYIKAEYASYMESDNWEYFSTTFSNELSDFLRANPEIIVPDEAVVQTIYIKLLDYYLDGLVSRYSGYELGQSILLKSLYDELLKDPTILNNNRSDLASIITNYLMSEEMLLLQAAGSILNVDWNLAHELDQQRRLIDMKETVLDPYFSHYIESVDLSESEELWRAAIRDVLLGESLADYRVYFPHSIGQGDTIGAIAEKYGIDGREIVRHSNARFVFEKEEDQQRYDFLYAFRNIDDLYSSVRNLPLKPGDDIMLSTETPYTGEWWERRGIEGEQRDMIMKNYIYGWIDSRLPQAFDDFVQDSPYIEYIENRYGIRFSELRMYTEERSVFSNPKTRQLDPDFAAVYNAGGR